MTRYSFLFAALIVSAFGLAQESKVNLLIGTYTKTCDSKGIYLYEFDTTTGEAKMKSATENVVNPSYLTVSKDKKFIYSVNEDGDKSQVSTFRYNSDQGSINFQSSINAYGADPCYIINDADKVIVATYSGGTISVFDKLSDGSLQLQKSYQHEGRSINKERQNDSHLHMVQFTPDGKYLLANDLGTDYIYIYKYNRKTNVPLDIVRVIKVKPGSGPRHLTFSPDGKYVYLLQELDGTLTTFKYKDGNLLFVSETTVVAPDFKGAVSAADIHVSADGKYLYATNRGDANTISCFEVKKNGKLNLKQTINTQGKGPRNFSFDPTGNFLLVAHQYTNEVVIFKVDKVTGELTDTGKRITLCSPVCLVFD